MKSACNAGELGFNPWVGKILWRREWQATAVFLPGDSKDRGAWRATVQGLQWVNKTERVTLSLSYLYTAMCFYPLIHSFIHMPLYTSIHLSIHLSFFLSNYESLERKEKAKRERERKRNCTASSLACSELHRAKCRRWEPAPLLPEGISAAADEDVRAPSSSITVTRGHGSQARGLAVQPAQTSSSHSFPLIKHHLQCLLPAEMPPHPPFPRPASCNLGFRVN